MVLKYNIHAACLLVDIRPINKEKMFKKMKGS